MAERVAARDQARRISSAYHPRDRLSSVELAAASEVSTRRIRLCRGRKDAGTSGLLPECLPRRVLYSQPAEQAFRDSRVQTPWHKPRAGLDLVSEALVSDRPRRDTV